MKKYCAPICDITVVHSHDIIAISDYEEELEFGMIFEMVAVDDNPFESES
jgi:hypothetical protein